MGGGGNGGRADAGSATRRKRWIRVISALAPFAVALVAAGSASAITVGGSAEQVYATGVAPNSPVSLSKRGTVRMQNADSLGGVLFRNVAPGTNYKVRAITLVGKKKHHVTVRHITVHSTAAVPWDPGVYNQEIPDNGYGYLTTRDGTQLAYSVHPPTQPAGQPSGKGEGGFIKLPTFPANTSYSPPYPTLIEYSGYGYANPEGPESGIAVLANLMGFAVVDVNMRGTGCSSGAFDFFEPLQNLDGYDVIEAIAKQPWVLNHKVGMLGISYGGISQLFTAQLQPPDLEAIAPLSVIDATATTLYPGGVLNDGFAVAWAEQRQQNAEPATGPGHGQEWANKRIKGGDTTCAANQALHGEAANLLQKIKENSTYKAPVADPLDPVTFVHNITVPTFMACQFEDEQTGGHCAELVKHFTGTNEKWFTFTNGAHVDSLDPYTYDRLYDFLQLYVAHKAPAENPTPTAATTAGAPLIYKEAMGLPEGDNVLLPEDPIQKQPTYETALAAFKALPHVRVLFDNGAGKSPPGATQAAGNPYPGFEETFSELPVPGTTAQSWYLGPSGTLNEAPPATEGSDSYTANPQATPPTDYGSNTGGGGLWSNATKWEWNWKQPAAGSAVSYVSAPLAANTVAVGAGAIHLWVKSSTPDVDLQATVSEVREDGKEEFVQNGWMRASERKLATDANNIFKQTPTLLEPIPTELASDVQPMPANEFVPVVIPLYFEGHAYRKGSRIKLTITADNGTQPIWSFHHPQPALGSTASESIAFSPSMPSSLILPIVPGVGVPTAEPAACPELRNEPCR
ncbi:MAG TPA: CocE/NonD family hydrolase [Solirubrobacteraceae bacterium]|nr:CocE/NonD family hydrolase [Solirubrobacteraceae bacterium]